MSHRIGGAGPVHQARGRAGHAATAAGGAEGRSRSCARAKKFSSERLGSIEV